MHYDLSALDDLYRPGIQFLTFRATCPDGHEVAFSTNGLGQGLYEQNSEGAYILVDPDFRLPGTSNRIKHILRNLYRYNEIDTPAEAKMGRVGTPADTGYIKSYRITLDIDASGIYHAEPDWDDEPFRDNGVR